MEEYFSNSKFGEIIWDDASLPQPKTFLSLIEGEIGLRTEVESLDYHMKEPGETASAFHAAKVKKATVGE